MRPVLLALDTSHRPGSIVLAEGLPTRILFRGCEDLPADRSTAQAFAVLVQRLLQSSGYRPQDVAVVAVTIGPGSFTGIRIAVTFAKTFAYATGACVLGISVMDVLAEQAAAQTSALPRRLWTLVDAHRGQLFAAPYTIEPSGVTRSLRGTQTIDIERWLEQLEPTDVVTGPIVERLIPRLPAGMHVVDANLRTPRAETVAQLAWRRWQQGQRDDLWKLQPDYVRQSAAEERLSAAPT